jgi:hypothetical protein
MTSATVAVGIVAGFEWAEGGLDRSSSDGEVAAGRF